MLGRISVRAFMSPMRSERDLLVLDKPYERRFERTHSLMLVSFWVNGE